MYAAWGLGCRLEALGFRDRVAFLFFRAGCPGTTAVRQQPTKPACFAVAQTLC